MTKRGPKPTRRTTHCRPPKAPAWLSPDARAVFDAAAGHLAQAGNLAPVDAGLLAAYSVAVCELRATDAVLATEPHYYTGPNGAVCPHPALKDRRAATLSLARLASALGIGATARKRYGDRAPTPEREDPLAEYMGDVPERQPRAADFINFARA